MAQEQAQSEAQAVGEAGEMADVGAMVDKLVSEIEVTNTRTTRVHMHPCIDAIIRVHARSSLIPLSCNSTSPRGAQT